MRFLSGVDAEIDKFLCNNSYSSVFVLTDSNTNKFCLPIVEAVIKKYGAHVFEICAGENSKNIHTCISIWEYLNLKGADRSSLLINLGGGMITDIGGFVASTYKRGVDFLNIPTSMLAMVDASIGGKNGINLGVLKNQIGTITDPVDVFVDPVFLKTLDRRNYLSGFAEAVKHGLLSNRNQLSESYKYANLQIDDLFLSFVKSNVAIKQGIVLKDPSEKAERKMLNFGHTIGHALESWAGATQSPLLHGEAVAWGMGAELYLSASMFGFPDDVLTDYVSFLKKNYELPQIKKEHINELLTLMQQDKKNIGGQVRFALLRNVGEFAIDVAPAEQLVRESIAFIADSRL